MLFSRFKSLSQILLLLTFAENTISKQNRRVLRIKSKKRKDKQLRYLSLGTSVTYGSGLEDKAKAYPFLLSPDATNLGIPASDARYPAACVQTMLKDAVFDVITIEYDRRKYAHLSVLVQRLRQRFPDAVIILTKMWNLTDVFVKQHEGKRKGVIEPIRAGLHSINRSYVKFSTEAAFQSAMTMPADMWFDKLLSYKDPIVDKIAEENNALVYEWEYDGEILDKLNERFLLFLDYVHLNIKGHEVVAQGLRELIDEAGPVRSDNVGDWGEGDFCTNWYESGSLGTNINGNAAVEAPYPIVMFEATKRKHAMELTDKISTIKIENPFDTPKKLYIIYMATWPNRLYPKTRVNIKGPGRKSSVTVNPMVVFKYPVHVQESKYVGTLEPGMNTLVFKRKFDTELPFRLVGFAMTNVEFSPSLISYWPGKEGNFEA